MQDSVLSALENTKDPQAAYHLMGERENISIGNLNYEQSPLNDNIQKVWESTYKCYRVEERKTSLYVISESFTKKVEVKLELKKMGKIYKS